MSKFFAKLNKIKPQDFQKVLIEVDGMDKSILSTANFLTQTVTKSGKKFNKPKSNLIFFNPVVLTKAKILSEDTTIDLLAFIKEVKVLLAMFQQLTELNSQNGSLLANKVLAEYMQTLFHQIREVIDIDNVLKEIASQARLRHQKH